jgi:TP901 family phage tail tape measure protein
MKSDELVLRAKLEATQFNKELDTLNAKTKSLKKELKEIEQTKGIKSEEYAKAKKEMQDAEKAADAFVKAMKKMDIAEMSMKELKKHAKDLAKEMDGAKSNTKEYADTAKRLGEVETRILKVKQQTAALKNEGMAMSVTWRDKAMKAFQDFGVLGVASMAGLAIAVKQAFGTIVTEFGDFDQAAADTKGELNLTTEEISKLKKEAMAMGPQMGKSAKEIMDAFNEIGSGKSELVKTKDGLEDVTKAALKMSIAGGIDMKNSAILLTESLNQFQAESKESTKFVDIMATGVQVGAAKFESLSESLKYVGPVAKAANVSFGETNAMLQVLARSGIKGEQAGTSLRGTLLELAKQADNTINPAVVGMQTAMENLAKKNYTAAQMSELVGKTNVVAALSLAKNTPVLKQFTAEIEKGGGAQVMFADKTDTLNFRLAQAKSILGNYVVQLGSALAPAIEGAIKLGIAFISTIAAIPKFVSDNKVAIGGFALALISFNAHLIKSNALLLYNAAVAKGKAIWDKAAIIQTNIMTVAQNGLNAAMKANPIGIVIGVLITLGTILYSVYQNSQTVRAGVAGLWAVLKEGAAIIGRIWTALKNLDFKAVSKEMSTAMVNMSAAYTKGYAEKVRSESKKTVAALKKDGQTVQNDNANVNANITEDDKKNLDERKKNIAKHKEDVKKANEEALKKIAELESEASLEHIRKMDGEVAYAKAVLTQKYEAERAAIQKSLESQENKAVQIRLLEAKLDRDLEKLEEENQKTTADIVERWAEEEFTKKIKKAQAFAKTELDNARKHIKDLELLAQIEAKINENLKDDIATIKEEQEADTIKKAEDAAKKLADIAKKKLDAEKFILQQETEATKAMYDWKELNAKGNANRLLKVQKERLAEEYRLAVEKIRLEQAAETSEAKEKIKDKNELEKVLLEIDKKYHNLVLIESKKAANERIDLEKKVKEEKDKVWKATSSGFASLLKGDLDGFVSHMGSIAKAEQNAWQKRLAKNQEMFNALGQMAQAAVTFLNDLAQARAEKAIAEVQREYEAEKAILDLKLAETQTSLDAAEAAKTALKESSAAKIVSIQEAENAKVKQLEDFYASLKSTDSAEALAEQITLANQEAEAKNQAAMLANQTASSNARQARDEKIIAAEAARDAEIAAINMRNDIDSAAKASMIASSQAKAATEIATATAEYEAKMQLSQTEMENSIKNATDEKEKKIELMKELTTADADKAKELVDTAKKEAEEKIKIAEKEKNDKLKIVEAEKQKKIQEKIELERVMHEEDKKAKQKEYDLKLKAWKAQQKADVASALIGGALAIVKALGAGFPLGLVMAAVTAVMTGIQIAKIKSQAPPAMPTFAAGGLAVGPRHGRSYGEGGIGMIHKKTKREFAEFEGGEWIVDRENTAANMPILKKMKQNKLSGKVVPLGFANGGVVDNIPWGKPMFQYGGRVRRMYEDGGDIPSPESVASQSAAAAAAEGGETANADRDLAKKQAEEQLENQKRQLEALKMMSIILMKIDKNTDQLESATAGVERAVRDTNQGSKIDSMMNSISRLGKTG